MAPRSTANVARYAIASLFTLGAGGLLGTSCVGPPGAEPHGPPGAIEGESSGVRASCERWGTDLVQTIVTTRSAGTWLKFERRFDEEAAGRRSEAPAITTSLLLVVDGVLYSRSSVEQAERWAHAAIDFRDTARVGHHLDVRRNDGGAWVESSMGAPSRR
jgi:hypothetical protein